MKKLVILLNIGLIFAFSFNGLKEVEYTKLHDDFTILGMPRENFLDLLGYEQTDYSNYTNINTVNMVSELVEIDGIIMDTEAIYYALYKADTEFLNERLEYHSNQALLHDDEYSYKKIHELQVFLSRNSVNNKESVLSYMDFTNQYEFNPKFFKDILLFENENIEFNLEYDKNIYQTRHVYYYEDYDLDNTLSGIYKESEIINVDLYYVKSEECNEFNFTRKLDSTKLESFLEELLPNQSTKMDGCYLQLFTHTDEMKLINVYDEELYPHNEKFVFEYQSHSSRPYLRVTVVFDFWNQEKMLITSENSSFKITKEAHYLRNEYNCEIVVYEEEEVCTKVNELYPTKYYMNEQDQWLYSYKNYFHQIGTVNKNNVKYLKVIEYYDDYYNILTNGNLELIYSQYGDLITEDLVTYTYNFGVTEIDHYVKDVFPYLVWGNTEQDRIENRSYARFIWDKDRFTSNKNGLSYTGNDLIDYFENNQFIKYIGTRIPRSIVKNEIDQYYFTNDGS